MSFAISPHHAADDFPDGLTLDDKIEIFLDRIDGWQLGVARQMIEAGITHRAVALLHIVTSYFEMIGKYSEGFVGEGRSKDHFNIGLRLVFPNMPGERGALGEALYKNVRSGLYHVGMTGSRVILSQDLPGSIGFNEEHNMLMISSDQLVADLIIRFEAFAAQLREPANIALRANFEARFDADNQLEL